jgi:hypothetical protein
MSATRLGQLRVTLGCLLFWFIWNEVPTPLPVELHRNYSPLSDNALIHLLASRADLWQLLLWVCRIAAALFTIGFFTRSAYGIFVVSLLANRLTTLHFAGGHDWICSVAILLALVAVPWGDGFSIDARGRPAPAPSTAYGYAVWAPGVILGMAFAAAGYSKLYESGLAWITTGAVAYHFVEDASAAPVTWGLWIAAHPPLPIFLSAGAVFTELAVLPLVLIGRSWSRWLALGLSLCLFSGFYLFQGALWLPWVMWVATLLPWTGHFERARLFWPQRESIAVVAVVQLLASVTRVEIEPVMSPYPMYAGTYASPADFEAKRRRKFQRVEALVDGRTLEIVADASDELAQAVVAVGNRQLIPESSIEAIQFLCDSPGATPRGSISVRVERTRLDWTTPTVSFHESRHEADLPCDHPESAPASPPPSTPSAR